MPESRSLKDRLPEIVEKLAATYRQGSTVDHLDHSPLPNREIVAEICEDFNEVLYPGYGRRQGLSASSVGYHIGDVLERLYDTLSEQIARALRHEYAERRRRPCKHVETSAQEVTLAVFDELPQLRGVLALDVQAALDGDPAAKHFDEIVFCYPGLEAITMYRVAHAMLGHGVPLIPRMITELAHSKTGIDIHPGATIGKSFFIDHGTGVVIGETTEIGDNVKLYQGVTLGALSFPKDPDGKIIRGRKRHPTVGNNVVIYANATLLGASAVIGDNCVVNSSVWLTRRVAPGTTVGQEKPRLRMRHEFPDDLDGYVPDYQI
jgi:serine O-acetyltransferase